MSQSEGARRLDKSSSREDRGIGPPMAHPVVPPWTVTRVVLRPDRVVLEWPNASAGSHPDTSPPAAPERGPRRSPCRAERLLHDLADTVGGADSLAQLHDRPLTSSPRIPDGGGRSAEMLATMAARWFGGEAGIALHTGLALAAREDRDLLSDFSAEMVAASVCWAVGHANGTLGRQRTVTQRELLGELGIDRYVTQEGHRVARAIRTRGMPDAGSPWSTFETTRPKGPVLRLLRLGRPQLLLSSVRRDLLSLRRQAYDELVE